MIMFMSFWRFIDVKSVNCTIGIAQWQFLLYVLFILFTKVTFGQGDESKVFNSLQLNLAKVWSGENAPVINVDHRFAPSFLMLQYNYSKMKRKNNEIGSSFFSVKTEILSSFYIPVLLTHLRGEKHPFTKWRKQSTGILDIIEIRYLRKVSSRLSVGPVFSYMAINNLPGLMDGKFAPGINVRLMPIVNYNRLVLDAELARTIKTPTFNKYFPPSPYNAWGLITNIDWQPFSSVNHQIYVGGEYWRLASPLSARKMPEGYFYRINAGYKFNIRLSK